jgi:GTP-binding protein
MLPVVALVGRPNVGKSTLFNRLTRTRDALVADFPGLTRDRKYGQAVFAGQPFIVVDTGGIDGTEDGIETKMAEQSLAAIEEADVVLFMVDARAGLNVADQGIAQHLRETEKQVLLVANKCDGIDADSVCGEFYALAMGEVHQIAAAHGRGLQKLLEIALPEQFSSLPDADDAELEQEQLEELSEAAADAQAEKFADLPVKLAIIGKPNVGKSTLTNRILGEERVVVYDMPGTTRDSVYIPMCREDKDYVLIDTAGVRRRGRIHETVEKFSVIKTLRAIEDANVVLLVVDAREGLADQDLSLLSYTLKAGRSLVIAVNKWDGLNQEIKEHVKSELDRRLDFIDFAKIHFISALHGSGVGHLFESVDEAYRSATARVSTSTLTRVMKLAQDDHQPPMFQGRRIKLKYAHAGGYNPPIVVIHGNQVDRLPASYKRFLTNYYRKSLKMVGTPLKLVFQSSENPFEGRRKALTKQEQHKRGRVLRQLKNRGS